MSFDVTEGVRSPGWDRGHDEESRNGRDVKIDILDDYIRTSERFRLIRVFFRVPESYGNSPGSIWALLGHTGIEERGHKEGGARPPSGSNWKPPFPYSSPPLSFSPTPTREGGVLLPVGVGLPPWRSLLLGRPPPPCSFIYGSRGHPIDTTIDH